MEYSIIASMIINSHSNDISDDISVLMHNLHNSQYIQVKDVQ